MRSKARQIRHLFKKHGMPRKSSRFYKDGRPGSGQLEWRDDEGLIASVDALDFAKAITPNHNGRLS